MVKSKNHSLALRWFNLFWLTLCLVMTTGIFSASLAQSKQTKPAGKGETPAKSTENKSNTEDTSDPNSLRPLNQSESVLSLASGQKLVAEAEEAIKSGKYDIAATKLQQARKTFNQLSNFYLQLTNSFSGIDPKVSQAQRAKALQTGQLRDETTYQLALVHRAQEKPELAVPLLIQVILSQNPSSELGKKSYQQLYELGFVDVVYPSKPTQPNPAPKSP